MGFMIVCDFCNKESKRNYECDCGEKHEIYTKNLLIGKKIIKIQYKEYEDITIEHLELTLDSKEVITIIIKDLEAYSYVSQYLLTCKQPVSIGEPIIRKYGNEWLNLKINNTDIYRDQQAGENRFELRIIITFLVVNQQPGQMPEKTWVIQTQKSSTS